jgi:error-prone DNA polymerase
MQPRLPYTELHCLSCFSFLRGASHPAELVAQASALGYAGLAITDECSLAGVVKAHVAAKEHNLTLIIGSEFNLVEGIRLVALAPNRAAYGELSGLISLARRRSPKGEYHATLRDLIFHLKRCLLIWLPRGDDDSSRAYGRQLARLCRGRVWIGVHYLLGNDEIRHYRALQALGDSLDLPLVACGDVQMHCASRKALHDVFAALRHRVSVAELGSRRLPNAQQHLRSPAQLARLYPPELLAETQRIARRCRFSLDELRYEYPEEVVPPGHDARSYLRELTERGARERWPGGVPVPVRERIETELALIAELDYEYYFLTVYDVVRFARERGILCQGRGSAANSVVCYCLFITEVSPEKVSLLFERFISRERDEPPDIDVDFEHERREEVIQYIYDKYTRRRAALAATLITYRARSAVRDVGRALGLDPVFVDDLAKSLAWWDKQRDLEKRFAEQGLTETASGENTARLFYRLVQEILGFPRHLSQHVGGFVISRGPISQLVPVENAAMAERTVIQWDKEDIEALGLLKVDVLALGMLSAIRKSLVLVSRYEPRISRLQDIPAEDAATYRMLQRADSIGVFQIESRAQMTMLPRLKPACFYDLVIEIAIVRPGPIQGDMVHPYLRRRQGLEAVTYPDDAVKSVLERTLGVPIFQEQVIRLAMVAAGFSGGEADQLRRAITNWGRNSKLLTFEQKLTEGMLQRAATARITPAPVRPDQGLRRLRLSRVALGELRPARLRLRLAEVPSPGGVLRGTAEQPAHGLLHALAADPGRAPPRPHGAARGREPQRLGSRTAEYRQQRSEGADPPRPAPGERPVAGGCRALVARGARRCSASCATCASARSWTAGTWRRWSMRTPPPASAAIATRRAGRSWPWNRRVRCWPTSRRNRSRRWTTPYSCRHRRWPSPCLPTTPAPVSACAPTPWPCCATSPLRPLQALSRSRRPG